MKNLRLVIAVPSQQEWSADFGMSMCFLIAKLSQAIPGFKTQQYRVHNKRGSILAQLRQKMVEECLKNDATHLLFIDSDQTFPSNIVERLLSHEKKVVACNIATKMLPANPTARQKGSAAGVPVYTTEESTGLEEVWRVGTGIMLLDLSLFKRKGMEKPWFEQHWNEELQDFTGEDWAFCEKLESVGIKIYIDHDVSKEVGHVGKLIYTHDFVEIPDGALCTSEKKRA